MVHSFRSLNSCMAGGMVEGPGQRESVHVMAARKQTGGAGMEINPLPTPLLDSSRSESTDKYNATMIQSPSQSHF